MQSEYRAYSYRWLILAIFCSLEMTNNILWVTFAPISDIASNYFGGGSYGSTTAVNMLANTFLILYLPGTGLSILLMKYCNMKRALEICAFLTTFGAMLRYIASAYRNDWGNENAYLVMLLGQAFAAMGQPMFLNSPPAIASIWFPTTEREIATTIGSMCAPIGSAIGQIIPFLLVTQSSINGKDPFNLATKIGRYAYMSDHISQRTTMTTST
jgi:FLVCR family MFS transporter 7